MRLYLHKAGSIEEGLSGVGIRDAHADIVALARVIPMWRIWRRLARDGCRGEAQVSCSDYRELSAMIDRYCVPMNSAVMLKDIEHRISGRESFPSHVGAINLQRRPFSQHEQPGRVIDLSINQDHCAYCGIAQGSPRLQLGKCAELGKYIGGSVEQNPVGVVPGDGYRGLSSCPCANHPSPETITVRTITIPLRKTAAGR